MIPQEWANEIVNEWIAQFGEEDLDALGAGIAVAIRQAQEESARSALLAARHAYDHHQTKGGIDAQGRCTLGACSIHDPEAYLAYLKTFGDVTL